MMQENYKKKLNYNILFKHGEKLSKKIKTNKKVNFGKKTILVTGGSGSLGFEIAKRLSDFYIVYVLYRNKNSNIKYLSNLRNIKLVKTSGIEKKYIGIEEEKYLHLSSIITDIYHCAALISNSESFLNLYRVNVKGFMNILKFSQNIYSKKIEYMSTLSVNISYKNFISEEKIYPNSLNKDSYKDLIPKNNYTATKIINEVILSKTKKNLSFNIYRLGLLFNKSLNKKSYIYLLLKDLKKNKKIISGYENYAFDYTPYNFAAEEILKNKNNNTIRNISLNQKITLKTLQIVLKLKPVKYQEYPSCSWLKVLLKNNKHDIFEMTNINGFVIENNKKYNLRKIINEWYKSI